MPLRLASPLLERSPVRHGFSFSLELMGSPERFLEACGLAGASTIPARQVHGNAVRLVRSEADAHQEVDALVTDRPGLALTIRTADCLPVLLADPEAGIVGAAHAGWRGTRIGVARCAVESMLSLGARPERIRAALGPAVEARCYEVGPEVVAAYREALPGCERHFAPTGRHLDLAAVNRESLLEAGLLPQHIEALPVCTRCDHNYASFRRDGDARSENLSVIALSD